MLGFIHKLLQAHTIGWGKSAYCQSSTTGSFQSCVADDELEIRTLVSFHGKANVQYILDITPLNEVVHCAMLHSLVQLSSWP